MEQVRLKYITIAKKNRYYRFRLARTTSDAQMYATVYKYRTSHRNINNERKKRLTIRVKTDIH